MLLKKQRNELFTLLTTHNLQPSDFSESNSQNKYELVSKNYPYRFSLAIDTDATYRVSSYPYLEGLEKTTWYYWEDVLIFFEDWVAVVQEDDNAPDLWNEAQANAKLFALNEEVPDEMFTTAELRQLEGQVRHLSQQLATLGLPVHAQKALTATIEEIPKKATRLTKEEVRGWFMSAIVAQVTNLALSPEHVAAVGHLLKTTFMGLLQLH